MLEVGEVFTDGLKRVFPADLAREDTQWLHHSAHDHRVACMQVTRPPGARHQGEWLPVFRCTHGSENLPDQPGLSGCSLL